MTAQEREQLNLKIDAEISKLISQTAKINSENRWYPFVVGSGVTLAIMAIAKLFL